VRNGYFVGAINRVGIEPPWKMGEFYGKSYFCDPRGKIVAQAPRDKDAVVVADLNLDMIEEVRSVWQFFRDRRPDAYGRSSRRRTRAPSSAAAEASGASADQSAADEARALASRCASTQPIPRRPSFRRRTNSRTSS
jgi:hypothetical protein